MKRFVMAICLAVVLSAAWGCASAAKSSDTASLPPLAGEAATPETSESGPGAAQKLILYLPNRALDITDMISLAVGLPTFPKHWLAGFVHVNAHATRAVQVGAGNTNENIMVGLGYKRQFLPWFEEKYELSGGPVTFAKHKISRGNNKTDFGKTGIFFPADEPFATGLMDYWGVGAEATVLPIGIQAGVHPVEIADAVLGFFMLDITGDDF